MVKSGLINNTDVSHYRLASHLSVALIILSLTFWFILENSKTNKFSININNNFLNIFFITIIIQNNLGSLSSRFKWRLLYNSWPDMNGSFIPDKALYKQHQELRAHKGKLC